MYMTDMNVFYDSDIYPMPVYGKSLQEEKLKFQLGLARKEFRKKEAARSLFVSPPTQSEVVNSRLFPPCRSYWRGF